MADCSELLFFDTFSHENSEELNLDLVQFPKPVFISEVRIIPLGARVQADFPGGVRLGATNPTQFQIEFFVNDLSKPGASTFESLGALEYRQNGNIQLECEKRIPTDGLVLRGWYSTITLAVYGVLTKSVQETATPQPTPAGVGAKVPPPAPPHPLPLSLPLPHPPPHAHPPTLSHPPRPHKVHLMGDVSGPPPSADWPPSHPPVSEGSVEVSRFPLEGPDTRGDAYGDSYTSSRGPHHGPPPEYRSSYQDDWSQQSQVSGHSAEVYDRAKESFEEDKPPWERMKDDRDRRDWDKERDRKDRSSRGSSREHEYRDREWDKDGGDREWSKDHDWEPHRFRDKRDRSNSIEQDDWDSSQQPQQHTPPSLLQLQVQPPPQPQQRRNWTRPPPPNNQPNSSITLPLPLPLPLLPLPLPLPLDRVWDRNQPGNKRDGSAEREERKRPRSPPPPPQDHPQPLLPLPIGLPLPLPMTVPVQQPLLATPGAPPENQPSNAAEDSKEDKKEDMFEPLSPGGMEDISDGEIPEVEPPSGGEEEAEAAEEPAAGAVAEKASPPKPEAEVEVEPEKEGGPAEMEEFEEIVSDEDIVDEVQDGEMDYETGEYWEEFQAKTFNPYNWEAQPLVHFHDPSLTPYEIALSQANRRTGTPPPSDQAEKLQEILHKVPPSEEDWGERWVESAEQLPTILSRGLAALSSEDREKAEDILSDWVSKGLDIQLAMNQSQAAFKIRHIKAGVRLAQAATSCGARLLNRLLGSGVQWKLLQLYGEQYMAVSIRLMIIRALDTTLHSLEGLEMFLEKFGETKDETAYQCTAKLILGKAPSRAKFALTSLIQRVHLYEMLSKLKKMVGVLVQSNPLDGDGEKEGTPKAEGEEPDIESIIACLDEIISLYTKADILLSHPQLFLPASVQYQLVTSNPEMRPAIYSLLRKQQLLESILILLTCPSTAIHPKLLAAIQDILQALLESQEGMLFLLSQAEVVMGVARALLPSIPGEENGRGEEALGSEEGSQLQHTGLHMVHCLQVLSWVDTLVELSSNGGESDGDEEEQEVLDVLQGMYHLLFSQPGRLSLVHVMSRSDNLNMLMPFIRPCGEEELDTKMKKSAARGYAVDLLTLVVKHSTYAPFLQRFGDTLLQICRQEESSKLRDLISWLSVAENPEHFTVDGVSSLSEILKHGVEDAVNLPGDLIQAARLLQYLAIPTCNGASKDLEFTELKLKYALAQLVSCDGLTNSVAILQNLCNAFEQPALHTATYVGPQGVLLTALVLPLIHLVRQMLTGVIHARNTAFRDLTAVPTLLQTYVFMHAFPGAAASYTQAQEICQEVVLTLLAYTQPVLDAGDSEDALSKSLWTLMVAEVLKFVTSAPYRFIPSLLVMSEMLPLPLPIHTKQPLLEDECNRAVLSRKLWSAHLLPLASPIQELIARLSGSSFQPLLQLLRRVCVQLADLAAPASLVVCRAVLDTVSASMESDRAAVTPPSAPEAEPVEQVGTLCLGHTSRLLNFLACLVSHASVKAGVLHLCRGGSKSDEKYIEFLPSLSSVLLTPPPQGSHHHIQAQECVVSILQCLCDTEISLLALEDSTPSQVESYLSNSLPAREQLLQMCSAMLEHVSNLDHGFTTLLPTLRTLVMFTEHDYGFHHLKSCLEKQSGALSALFSKISCSFSKDSSDCLSTLSTALELLRLLLAPEEDDGASTGLSLPPRTGSLTPAELAVVLQWNKEDEQTPDAEKPKHPVLLLEKQLQEWSSEEEAMESLAEQVSFLVRLLEDEGRTSAEGSSGDTAEPILPSADLLAVQFATRPVFMISDCDEERLGAGFWLSPPPVDEADQDGEQVPCNLLELSHTYLGDWELAGATRQLCKPRDELGDRGRVSGGGTGGLIVGGGREDDRERGDRDRGGRDRRDLRDRERQKTLVLPPKEIKPKKAFVSGNRARGFGRPPPSSRSDPFRSRPPNTSRPPSLHVDDFVKLESAGQQPTGPTGYNKMSMRAAKELIASRSSSSRGRGFGSERGGRFFGGRRESTREVTFGRGIIVGGGGNGGGGGGGVGGTTPGIPSLWAALRAAEVTSMSGQRNLPSFRTPPDVRDVRASVVRSVEDKFGGNSRGWGGGGGNGFGGRGKDRERRGGGGARRDIRHARAFTR